MINLHYRKAEKSDAEPLIDIYNSAFYDDYVRYGECPAYGKTVEQMENSIESFPKEIVISDNIPVGVISVEEKGDGIYYIGCLCIVPEYQGKGIGTQTFRHILSVYPDWKKFVLITPADKEENIRFYTEKCGFRVGGISMDGNVKVVNFIKER
ncbi:MAG: GNAT family N-acetyltransferase [Ruminococcus sp.]